MVVSAVIRDERRQTDRPLVGELTSPIMRVRCGSNWHRRSDRSYDRGVLRQ